MMATTIAALVGAHVASEPPERIVVTETREERRLVDTPGAVTRFESDEVRDVDSQHVQELLNRAPGVFLNRGSGREHLTAIRSPVLTSGAGAGSFLFLEDGVPLRAAGFANINGLFESVTEFASGVEVTRGPGSALYGSNAVHGLVNVLSPAPAGDENRLRASTGSFDRSTAKLETAFAIGDARGLAGFSASHEGGWRAAAGLDEQKALVRLDAGFGGWATVTTATFTNLNQETAGFVTGRDAYRDPALRRANENPEAFRDARSARFQSRWKREFDEGAAVSVTPFARWNEMRFLQHFLPSKALEESGHHSAGVLTAVAWNPSPGTQTTLGADLEVTSGWLTETQALASFGSFPQGVHYDYDVDALVAAGYGRFERRLTPTLTAVVEARAEAVRYDYETAAPPGTSGRFLVPESRADVFGLFTPKAALIWNTGRNGAAYGRFARGQRAPQTSDLYRLQAGQSGEGAGVETLDSWEAGWRGAVGEVELDVAVYAMRKTGYFFRDADGLNVSNGVTRHRGVEIAADAPLGAGFAVRTRASYARHTYDFDRLVKLNVTESIRKGDDFDTAPRWTANTALTWAPTAATHLGFEWVHVGAYFTDAANTQSYPGHDVLNVRGEWRLTADATVFGAVRNVLDAAYAERADFAFGNERYFPGEDRAFTIGIDARF